MFKRSLWGPYAFVFGGLALGLFIGGVVIGTDPAFAGWIVGGGLGLSGGSWAAALSSNEALVGRGGGSNVPPHMRGGTMGERRVRRGPPIRDHESAVVEHLRREGATVAPSEDEEAPPVADS